jgi:uncharacterized cupin superfamily protein
MSLRDKLVRSIVDLEFGPSDRAPLYDGNRSARVIGPRMPGVAASKLGASYDELGPGKVGCPFHFHYAQEEMFVILEGQGTLRVADERIAVRAGDVIDIPAGPEYPHQILNTSQGMLKYLSISTQEHPEVCEYPDSGKYLTMTPVAGPLLQGVRLHRPDSALDYWDGEP